MKYWLLLGLFSLSLLAGCGRQRDARELLTELHKLKSANDDSEQKRNAPEEMRLRKQRSVAARALLKEFETDHADSPQLNQARLETLKILRGDPEANEAASTGTLAETILAEAPRGSDIAAQADLYLAMREFQNKFKGIRSAEELKDAWNRNAESLRGRFERLFDQYPKDRHVADAAQEVLRIAEMVDDPKTTRTLIDLVAKNQPSHPIALREHREKTVLGKLGKEFVFEFTPVGFRQKASLKDLRGKVVVLDFWATWCPPCREEIPHLKKLYEKYHSQGLEILGISQDHRESDLTEYVKSLGIPWRQVFGDEAKGLAGMWQVEMLPTVYIIDRQGRLHSMDARGKLEKLVPELLRQQ